MERFEPIMLQERFRSITKAYYRNSVGVLLVYDITDMTSFQNVGQVCSLTSDSIFLSELFSFYMQELEFQF